jgi:carboxypeptidase Q
MARRRQRSGAPSPSCCAGEFAKSALRVLAPIGVLMADQPPKEVGTDIGPTVDAGVPGFLLRQHAMHYFDVHHTPDDTLDKVDRQDMDQNVAAWAALVWLAADSDVYFRPHAATAAAPPTR